MRIRKPDAYNPGMNPRLSALQPYPFERLRALVSDIAPPVGLKPISLSIGEPQHPTPQLLLDAFAHNLKGLAKYPLTKGESALRAVIAGWLCTRYGLNALDPETEIIPVLGSREGLFAIAQAVLDPAERDAIVICPNPFYQIYEGATLLAGATPYFLNLHAANGFRMDWSGVPASTLAKTRLVFVCSPNNPTGTVMTMDEWRELFALSDKYGFVIVADECYSEVYFDEHRAPLGALEAAHALRRDGFPRLIVMGSLSKRSNAPGLRSGYCAGDAAILKQFLLYRTYHGSAMSLPVQMASIAAWADEQHVRENRALYRDKFARFFEIVNPVWPLSRPQAGFYYWMRTPGDELAFTRELLAKANVAVLPGSYLSRDAHGENPGRGYVRLALVASLNDAIEAATRVARILSSHQQPEPIAS